jgi:hypothetical protein
MINELKLLGPGAGLEVVRARSGSRLVLGIGRA